MDWPLYFKDRLIVGNPDSEVGVVTLWTPKETVAEELSPADFCLVGQLYTKRGINFILRNILARPTIRRLYIVGQDRMGSGEALLALIEKGATSVGDILDKEISVAAIEAFRKNVEVVDCRGDAEITFSRTYGKMSFLESGKSGQPWREPEVFPEASISAAGPRPSEGTNFVIRRSLVSEVWVTALKHILRFGITTPTIYGGNKRELVGVVGVIEAEDPSNFVVPSFLGVSKEDVQKYIAEVFKPERGEEPYTYGERLLTPIDQIEIMVKKLQAYPSDPGALAILWQPEVDNFATRKPWRTPCLTLIQGIIHPSTGSGQGSFLMTAYFRSNDMFGAYPLNAFALRHLQGQIAARLGVNLGSLTTISHCAHIYDNGLAEAAKIVADHASLACRTDPRGNFVIEVVEEEIVVKHLSPEGVEIGEYRGQLAQEIGNQIVRDLGISDISHALDLGAQLARAEEAIRHKLKFVQDRPLACSELVEAAL